MLKNCQNFKIFVDEILNKSPLQKKKILHFFESQDELFFQRAEEFSKKYLSYLTKEDIPLDFIVKSYLKMCHDFMKSQIYFAKHDKYPVECAKTAFENVYSNEFEMKSYMVALAISQFLWPTHYKMYDFHAKMLEKLRDTTKSYLEIGPGHGLFLVSALSKLDLCKNFMAVDISPVSVNISRTIVENFSASSPHLTLIQKDMLEFDQSHKYDFITMGEVLEHVNNPDALLRKLGDLLTDNGNAFISTCVNCPSIDHVYQFKCINHIREIVNQSNLRIVDELILPVEELPFDEIMAKKITVNYCAHVAKNAI